MASEFGSPIAQNVNPVGAGIQSLSGILGLEQQQLGLQQSRANIGIAQAQEQQQQVLAKQAVAMRSYYQNMNLDKHLDPATGTLNVQSVLDDPEFRDAAGSQLPDAIKDLTAIKQSQLQNRQSLINLNSSARSLFDDIAGSYANQPDNAASRSGFRSAMQQFSAMGPDEARVASIYSPLVENLPAGKFPQALKALQLQAMTTSEQANVVQPQYYGFGSGSENVNPYASAQSPTGFRMGVAPGVIAGRDLFGNPIFINQQNPGQTEIAGQGGRNIAPAGGPVGSPQLDRFGNPIGALETRSGNTPGRSSSPSAVSSTNGIPMLGGRMPAPWLIGQNGQQGSDVNGFYRPPVATSIGQVHGEEQQALTDQKMYSSAITAGNRAPLNKNLLNHIIQLSEGGLTGVGSQQLAEVEGAIGQVIPGFQGATDAATRRMMLGKYTSQLLMNTMLANGYPTDEARGVVQHAFPNPENMTPQAIRSAAHLVMAQTEIGQAESSFAREYQQANGSSSGFQQAQGWFLQHIDPRMFDALGESNQALNRSLNKWFGNNVQEKHAFLQNMNMISKMGGFDYASEPQQ